MRREKNADSKKSKKKKNEKRGWQKKIIINKHALTGYSVLNFQKENSQGNQIKTYLSERLKTEKNCSINQKKRPNVKT